MRLPNLICFIGCFLFLQLISSFTIVPTDVNHLESRLLFKTMIIQKSTFDSLINLERKPKALFFSSDYDNRHLFARDRISLAAYAYYGSDDMQLINQLKETEEKGKRYRKDRSYSSYVLPYNELKRIVDTYNKRQDIEYYLLVPVPYDKNSNYNSYQIIAADKNKKELYSLNYKNYHKEEDMLTLSNRRSFSTDNVGNDYKNKHAANAPVLVVYTLNPSPPASFE